MIEEHLETEEYTKELIAQTSGPLVDTEVAMGSRTYGIKTPDTIYYNAFKLYDEDKRFVGIQVDQYTDESGTPESHWLSYIWYYGAEEWGIYAYSEEDGGLIPVTISGKNFYNVWFDMFWLIQGNGEYGHAITGYQLNTSKAVWAYTYTANDVKKICSIKSGVIHWTFRTHFIKVPVQICQNMQVFALLRGAYII